jgi:predicted regulator of Ras-like GTPase activity (Roadblock/LC7/MglB family)
MDEGMVSEALASLREIPGVQGAFVVDPFGRVIARSVSSLFPDYALQAAAQKISLLSESVYENFDASEEILLAFEGYSLGLRRGVFGTLVLLAERSANPEGIRMGTSVVTRRLVMLHEQPVTPQPAVARTLREAGAAPSGTDLARRTGSNSRVGTGSNSRVVTSGQAKPGTQRNAPISTGAGSRAAPPASVFGVKKGPDSQPDSKKNSAATKKKKNDIWG